MKENESDKFAVACFVCDSLVAFALTYQSADKSRDKHVRKTGHPKNMIHIKLPKLLKL